MKQWGYPPKMDGNMENPMDDDWGYSYFRKPAFVNLSIILVNCEIRNVNTLRTDPGFFGIHLKDMLL